MRHCIQLKTNYLDIIKLARQGTTRLQSVLEKLLPERVLEELMAEGMRPDDAIYHLRGLLEITAESLESRASELENEAAETPSSLFVGKGYEELPPFEALSGNELPAS